MNTLRILPICLLFIVITLLYLCEYYDIGNYQYIFLWRFFFFSGHFLQSCARRRYRVDHFHACNKMPINNIPNNLIYYVE